MDLEFDKFYIIEISYFDGNPIHQVLCRVVNEKLSIINVFNGFVCQKFNIKDLKHFKIIKKINIKER